MSRIIQERKILELLKEYNSKYGLLSEASKKDVLVSKLGFNEELAKVFDEVGKKLAIWLANKYLKYFFEKGKSQAEPEVSNQDILDWAKGQLNATLQPRAIRSLLSSVMDYIQVGLNGDKSSLDDSTIIDIVEKSHDWHQSLKVGGGKINYVENAPILIDFRDKNGEGYYWADLNVKNSPEECERMGHCGRSSYGYLYSLRSDKLLPGGKFKLNRSHLTAAIGTDGVLYQLKGPKNAKPKEEHHKYIQPLFYTLGGGGEEEDYLIRGFGTEYASERDFKLEDLPKETLKSLYRDRPELFKSRGLQAKMRELGIEIEVEPLPSIFNIELEYDGVKGIIDGDERRIIDKNNKMYLSEAILSNEWDYLTNKFDDNFDYLSWEEILESYVYDGLKSQIRRILMMMVEKNEEDVTLIKNYENKDLIELINEVDVQDKIKDALLDQYREVSMISYLQELTKTLIQTLQKYGEVNISNGWVSISGDLSNFVDLDDPEVIEAYNEVEHDHDEIFTDFVFFRLIDNRVLPKAEWEIPYPNEIDFDDERFNDYLNDELNSIERTI
jgi:hypothetical protein